MPCGLAATLRCILPHCAPQTAPRAAKFQRAPGKVPRLLADHSNPRALMSRDENQPSRRLPLHGPPCGRLARLRREAGRSHEEGSTGQALTGRRRPGPVRRPHRGRTARPGVQGRARFRRSLRQQTPGDRACASGARQRPGPAEQPVLGRETPSAVDHLASQNRHFRLRIGNMNRYNHVSGVSRRANASASVARRREFSVGTTEGSTREA